MTDAIQKIGEKIADLTDALLLETDPMQRIQLASEKGAYIDALQLIAMDIYDTQQQTH